MSDQPKPTLGQRIREVIVGREVTDAEPGVRKELQAARTHLYDLMKTEPPPPTVTEEFVSHAEPLQNIARMLASWAPPPDTEETDE